MAQEAIESAQASAQLKLIHRLRRAADRKREITEAQVAALRAGLEAELEELNQAIEKEALQSNALSRQRTQMARKRMAGGALSGHRGQKTQHDGQNQKNRK